MPLSAISIFSFLAIFTAWLGSFLLIILAFREKKHIGHAHNVLWSTLWQWSLALFLIVWVKIPTFLAAFGVGLVISELTSFYVVTFVFRIAAYFLFFRGMMALLSAKRFWMNTFPFFAFPALTLFTLSLIFVFQLPLSHVGNMIRPFHYAVIVFLIVAAGRLLRKRLPLFSSKMSRAGLALFIVGWVVFLASDIVIALGYQNLPTDFWFFNLISSPVASIGFSIAHLALLAAIVLVAYHRYEVIETS